MNKQLAIAI